MSFFDSVKETALNASAATASKAKEIAEVTKLKNAIASEERKVKEAYQSIGKKCFEAYGDEPDALYADEISTIKAAKEVIEKKKIEIEEAKQKSQI